MKLQIASDLHLHGCTDIEERYGPLRYSDSDVLILAGDIDRVNKVSDRFADWPCQVLYVRGNHDSYFTAYEKAISVAARNSTGRNFVFLERSIVSFPHVRVLGCCLWSDFGLFGRVDDALLLASYFSADYRCLRRSDGALLLPEDVRREHLLSVQWLSRVLATPFSGKTVVVTHHAPHLRSLDPRHGRSRTDAGFASDLTPLMRAVTLWVHGHTHFSCDYKVETCRIVCNPAGNRPHPNPHFNPSLVLDV
ncbi:metallophosphoesterase [Paraburkholderia strydomiana]|uniref:metallophosphoesterase n=1 Tax=Paraburkholderia strydomiana TaxID=1245417 RepID=UPI0038BD7A01